MNKQEALAVLQTKLAEYRRRSYQELAQRVGREEHVNVTGPSGVEYQVEIQVMWEREPEATLLVLGSIDDGGLRAFAPLCVSFVRERSLAD